jgi:hypothetical protein
MTSSNDPDRTGDGLKELLRVAWSSLANSQLTSDERREVRNQIKQYSAELRRYLELKGTAHGRAREQPWSKAKAMGSGGQSFEF